MAPAPADRRSSPRVTLRDIAQHAGVSATTVSFVLSGRRDMRISSTTEDRVLQSARQLGYRRRLVPRVTPTVGSPVLALLSDAIGTEAFAGEMIRGAIAAASERGYTVLMAESQGDADLESAAIASLLERGVEHIVYGVMDITRLTVPAALRSSRLVLLNCVDATGVLPAVVPDDYAAGRLAATTLLEAGHTDRIWVVGETPPPAFAGRRRLAGIRASLRSVGLTLGGRVKCGWWPDESCAAVTDMLERAEEDGAAPSAVIAMNDRTAMGVYQAAVATGRAIPDDLSVISFDNSDLARWLNPGLTSITLPHFDLGRRAVELLLDETGASGTHTITMPLRSRESIATPDRQNGHLTDGPNVHRLPRSSQSTTGGRS